jgi:hypothetical protein
MTLYLSLSKVPLLCVAKVSKIIKIKMGQIVECSLARDEVKCVFVWVCSQRCGKMSACTHGDDQAAGAATTHSRSMAFVKKKA